MGTQGHHKLALDLYARLRAEPGNLFFSPYSIWAALLAAHAGAGGETKRALEDLLEVDDDSHEAAAALARELQSRAEVGWTDDEGFGFHLAIANGLWRRRGYALRPDYVARIGVEPAEVDFDAAEAAADTINTWIESATEGRIRRLIQPAMLSASTRLVLVNAVYFKAPWATPFERSLTRDEPFRCSDGRRPRVPTMRGDAADAYLRAEGFEAVRLRYAHGPLRMVIVLPAEGRFEEVEQRFSFDVAPVRGAPVDLHLPRFRVDSFFPLSPLVPAAFEPGADYTRTSDEEGAGFTDGVHAATIDVSEEGTEAAAATGMDLLCEPQEPPQPIEVRIDRPFLFFIEDALTRTVLFLGRVVDPTA